MSTAILLCITILLSCSKSLLYRGVGCATNDKTGFWFINTLSFGTACIIQFFVALFTDGICISKFTVLLVLPFFLLTLTSQCFYINAQKYGSVALNTFIYSCGFIIPAIYGIAVMNEPVNIFQGIGILLMCGSIYLYLLPKRQNTFSVVWLICILCASFVPGQ